MNPAPPATVLYTAWAPFFSGAERALVVLLDHLDRARYRPVVAVGTRGELEAALVRRGIPTAYVPVVYSGARTLPSWLATVGRLVNLARAERAAILHANDVPSFQPAGYAARWLRRPAVTHVRFPDTRAGFEWFLKPGFARAVFVSEVFGADMQREAPGLFAGRSEVLRDGVQIPDLPDESARADIRREFHLPLDRPVVALTGQVAEVKGLWEFLDAAAMLVGRRIPVSFAVLGDDLRGKGALRAEAERVAAARGLAGHVTFLGFRSDALRLLPAFDVVAVPSHVEPLGLAALEAMAAGAPVVGSRVGGILETVVHGETGLLVPARDAAALAAAIEALVVDPARRRAFGQVGRERARAVFSAEAQALRMQAIYDRMRAAPTRQGPVPSVPR